MKILIKNAKILHPSSLHHGQRLDIFIQNGVISAIGKDMKSDGTKVITGTDLHVSAGWIDVGAQTGDPGLEHREDLHSVARAAAAGGFTALVPFPNTDPVIQTKSEIEYIRRRTEGGVVDFHPLGAVTSNCEGKDITEMYDMRAAGAVAFSDGKKSIQHGGVLLRALQYVSPFDGVILHVAYDHSVAGKGQMHEGLTSTMLGLKGIPTLAEELMVQRDLSILEYAGSRLHLANISTAGAVELVKKAKKNGLKITASVAAMNLGLEDFALENFDTNLKVIPPLRDAAHIRALKAGLKDGTIDFIASNHVPLDVEAKELEFPYAEFGAIGLETCFAVAHTELRKTLDLAVLVEKFSATPRRILGLPMPKIQEKSVANLTVFDPSIEWTFSEKNIFSKSKNTPFVGTKFTGKVVGVVNNGQAFWLEQD